MIIADDPANLDAAVALGQLLHETDRYDEAVTLLDAAVARDATHADARNFLGIALKSVGRLDEAPHPLRRRRADADHRQVAD
ncbi:MAG: tetratricopeptide repeat protein [Sphingomicrobium sp.]